MSCRAFGIVVAHKRRGYAEISVARKVAWRVAAALATMAGKLNNRKFEIMVRGFTRKQGWMAGALMVCLVTAMPVLAKTPLAEEAHINESLLAVAVADKVRKTCPNIYARMVTFYFKAKALEKYARKLGYTENEVEAFLDDKSEKARVNGLAQAYMADRGVIEGDVESYCQLGRAEIVAGSLIGSLLGEK